MTSSFRTERDSMGELKVPAEALWGEIGRASCRERV